MAHLETIIEKSSAQSKDVVFASTYIVFFWVSVGITTELSPSVKASSVGPSNKISTLNCNTECRSPSLITFVHDGDNRVGLENEKLRRTVQVTAVVAIFFFKGVFFLSRPQSSTSVRTITLVTRTLPFP